MFYVGIFATAVAAISVILCGVRIFNLYNK
jgi:hypothetical protein